MQPLGFLKRLFVPCKENLYRPRILSRSSLLFFLSIVVASEGFLITDLVARQSNINFLAAVVPSEVIALTNTEREELSIRDVDENAALSAAAQAKANDMAAKGYFSHNGPDGKTPWQWISQFSYHYQYAGENLAVRFIDSKDVVSAWMLSPTHRANIVKPVYSEIGVGVAQGLFQGSPATFVVQYFAAPASVAVAPAAASTQSAAPIEVTTAPTVAGEQIEVTPAAPVLSESNSFSQSFVRQLIRALAEPKNISNWLLGFAATVLILALCLTFFMHVQVQPTNMLMGGVVVAGLAVSFLVLNNTLAEGRVPIQGNQSANIVESVPQSGVLVGSGAAVGYSMFPQE